MIKKQPLGRGLGALLKDEVKTVSDIKDDGAEKIVGNIAEIDISSILVNPLQPRTKFDEESIQELSQSIKELGLIQPITVRKVGNDKFELISGERRYKASKLAGLTTLPAYIRIANDQESLEMALVENIQREDLDAIEVALSYQRLIDECNLTQESMSTRVGKKRSTITNYLRLLKLDPIIQSGVRDRVISMGHARALINIENLADQISVYENVVRRQLSVRQTEDLVRDFKKGDKEDTNDNKKNNYKAVPAEIKEVVEEIREALDRNVEIKRNNLGAGKITISFKSDEDLKKIKEFFIK